MLMPDRRKHRGPHPADAALFASTEVPRLRQGVRDLSWLLSRGYAERSSLKLVGDRYRLRQRQRLALSRSSCSRQAMEARRSRELAPGQVRAKPLAIDGFNVLITVESALAGGFIFEGVDGCYRDLASVHGSYKQVGETAAAIRLAGAALEELEPEGVRWYLDRPVSNSGKLRIRLLEMAAEAGWNWEVVLCNNPDQELLVETAVVASSDSQVIDGARRWFNFTRFLVDTFLPDRAIIRMASMKNTTG